MSAPLDALVVEESGSALKKARILSPQFRAPVRSSRALFEALREVSASASASDEPRNDSSATADEGYATDEEEEENEREEEEEDEGLRGFLSDELGIDEGVHVDCGQLRSILLEEFVAEGGNSVIFRGVFEGATVAVKYNEDSDEVGADDLLQEFAILQALAAVDSVVSARALAAAPGSTAVRCMVLEYLSTSLEDRADALIREPREVREREVKSFAISAIAALRQVHERGVVHGDIHMGAFMFNATGALKLIDFGRAMHRPVAQSGEERFSIDKKNGSWNATDSPHLLSELELSDRTATWKDDLLRLGEVMFKVWDRYAWMRVQNKQIVSSQPHGFAYLDSLRRFKATLSWDMYDADARGPLAVEAFHKKVRNLPIEAGLPDYDSLIGLF